MSKDRIYLRGARRGVTYESLSIEQVERVEALAAGSLGKDSTVLEFQNASAREGVELMVREVTDPCSHEDFAAGEGKWNKLTYEQLHGKLGDFFTAKDIGALKSIYLREHVVSKDEVDAILEGKVPVVD